MEIRSDPGLRQPAAAFVLAACCGTLGFGLVMGRCLTVRSQQAGSGKRQQAAAVQGTRSKGTRSREQGPGETVRESLTLSESVQ